MTSVPPPRVPWRSRWRAAAPLVPLGVLLVGGTGYRWEPLPLGPGASNAARLSSQDAQTRQRLQAELYRLAPTGYHVVVDQTHNRLEVRRGGAVILDARCSAGSGYILRERGAAGRRWVFETPRGVFRVRHKTRNPVWRKPDWAFVEAGLPIPDDPGARIEYGVLGAYALDFGNGYMIHGTLYERLLGRGVTHGCIRLGREDLRRVYELVPVGAPVVIF